MQIMVKIDQLGTDTTQSRQRRVTRHFTEDNASTGLLQLLYGRHVVNALVLYKAVGPVAQAFQYQIVVEDPHDRSQPGLGLQEQVVLQHGPAQGDALSPGQLLLVSRKHSGIHILYLLLQGLHIYIETLPGSLTH